MFGGLCRTVWCGVSGENRIREALRIVNGPFLSLSLFSLLLFSNGVWFYLLFLVFPFLGCLSIVLWFLDVFAFLVHFLCTGVVFFQYTSKLLIKKKKGMIEEGKKKKKRMEKNKWRLIFSIIVSVVGVIEKWGEKRRVHFFGWEKRKGYFFGWKKRKGLVLISIISFYWIIVDKFEG